VDPLKLGFELDNVDNISQALDLAVKWFLDREMTGRDLAAFNKALSQKLKLLPHVQPTGITKTQEKLIEQTREMSGPMFDHDPKGAIEFQVLRKVLDLFDHEASGALITLAFHPEIDEILLKQYTGKTSLSSSGLKLLYTADWVEFDETVNIHYENKPPDGRKNPLLIAAQIHKTKHANQPPTP
jgi:hypothetical protein